MMEQGKKYLSDILQSITLIEEFVSTLKGFDDYVSDLKTRSAVERQLGIIGEAVNRLDNLYPDARLPHAKKIISFRNRLIHAYDAVDPTIVWAVIKNYLPALKSEVIQKLNNK